MPMRARWWGGKSPISRPWKPIFPERTGSSPMMLSIVVVLPAPFRPTRQTASLLPTLSETRRRICAGPRQVSMPWTSSMGGPEQVRRHRLVPTDLVGRAARQDAALVHGHDPIRVLEDHVHVVLDDHRGDVVRSDDRGDDIHDGRLLAGADAAGRLVEEEQTWPERERDRHVEQLAFALRDPAGELGRADGEAELAQDLERLLPHRPVMVGQREQLPGQVLAREDR